MLLFQSAASHALREYFGRGTRSLHTHLTGIANASARTHKHTYRRMPKRREESCTQRESINSVINTQANKPSITPPLWQKSSQTTTAAATKKWEKRRAEKSKSNNNIACTHNTRILYLYIANHTPFGYEIFIYNVFPFECYIVVWCCYVLSSITSPSRFFFAPLLINEHQRIEFSELMILMRITSNYFYIVHFFGVDGDPLLARKHQRLKRIAK